MSDATRELAIRGLSKAYVGAAGTLQVLDQVDIELNRSDALAVTGPSGSGKSTLLHIIGTLDRPTDGEVLIGGQNPFTLNSTALATFRNKQIGFIFQDHHLLPQCSVLENVLLPLLAGDGSNQATEQRARSLLDRVGLSARLSHRPAQLSGGERQRVAVCRALINEPRIVLADEPTGNLDQDTANSVGSLLLELARERNVLLICVTHSTELASRFPLRRELRHGKLIETASSVAT